MRLAAVRLSEVGHFRSGVALEGLSGRLDVLPGPNEAGKSTIFRAIETVFRVPWTAINDEVRALAPIAGGAPLVEVDFEAGGRRWRLRKRYLSARTVELVDLGTLDTLRGADAEKRVTALLAGRLGRAGVLPLLWVRQAHSLTLPDTRKGRGDDLKASLGQLIEDEIADSAGDRLARHVRDAIAKALDALVTAKDRKPAAGKPYKAAIDARDQARAAFEQATAAAAAAVNRLAALQSAELRAAALAAPDAAAARAAELAAAGKALDDGRRAEEALKRASLVVEAKQAALNEAKRQLQQMMSASDEAGHLRGKLAATQAALAAAAGDVEAGTTQRQALQLRQSEARARAAELQATLDAHDRAGRRAITRAAIAALGKRLASATDLAQRLADLDRQIAGAAMTDGRIGDIRRAAAAVDQLAVQQSAALPRVRIDYAPGAEAKVSVGGVAVAGSGEIEPAATLALDIEGIGRITVAAPAASAGDIAARLDGARARLAAALQAVGAPNVAVAEARFEAHRQLVADRQALAARLAVEAPDGVAALALEKDRLAATDADAQSDDLEVAHDGPPAHRPELVASLAAMRRQIVEIEAAVSDNQDRLLKASRQQSRLASQDESDRERLAELMGRLQPAARIEAEIAAARAAVATAEAELNAAARDRAAWADGVLEPAARALLDRRLAAAKQADKANAEQRQHTALEIREHESALVVYRQDGVEAALEEARLALEAAEARVSACQREVEELMLLERLLNEEAEAARASELKPVVDRLQAYARGVFPDAVLSLGDKLQVSGLDRGGALIAVEQLSGGTLEQVHVLVRLAYARLLADRGEGVPLLLDDALVYADAGRFRAMFETIEQAALHHQVIMLTCHAERIAALAHRVDGAAGARAAINIVTMTDWRPGDSALPLPGNQSALASQP